MQHSVEHNRNSVQSSRSQMNAVAGSVFATAILAVLVLQTMDSANAALSLSILIIILSGFTGLWRFKHHGIEPLALFCFMFVLYDGVILFRLATIGGNSVLPYPATFGEETYAATGVLCALAAGAVLLTTLAWESIVEPFFNRKNSAHRRLTIQPTRSRTLFWSGLCVYTFGIALYFVQFESFGGYLVALAMPRGNRFELAAGGDILSYPYLAFVVPGIACMCYGAEVANLRRQRITCYVLAAVWCALVILQGDRRLVLQTVLTIIGVLSVLRPSALKLKLRIWVLIAAAYFVSSTFAYVRPLITTIASGQGTPTEAVEQVADNWSAEWLLPEHTELAGPYLSLLTAVSDDTQLRYGSTYYQSLLTILPRFLYPGEKPQALAEGFALQVHQGPGVVSGWGFNPVAEAFANFGTIGIAMLFVCWTLFFLVVGSLRYRAAWGTLVAAVLLSEAMNANRIDFRNVFGESAYFLAGLIVAAFVNSVFAGLVGRMRVRIFPISRVRSAVTAL